MIFHFLWIVACGPIFFNQWVLAETPSDNRTDLGTDHGSKTNKNNYPPKQKNVPVKPKPQAKPEERSQAYWQTYYDLQVMEAKKKGQNPPPPPPELQETLPLPPPMLPPVPEKGWRQQ